MKAQLINNNGVFATFLLNTKEHCIRFYVDSEDIELVINKDFTIRYENNRRINEFKLKRILQINPKQSLSTIIMRTDSSSRVYMKDNFINRNQDLLDYRKNNLTYNQKEMLKYGSLMRSHVKHRKNDLYNNKLQLEDVSTIRKQYYNIGLTLKEIALNYNISVSAVSNIVNYRNWVDKNNPNIRNFKKNNVINTSNNYTNAKSLEYNSFKNNYNTYKYNNLLIYYEKLPIERLVYFEIRTINNEFICSFDLFFPANKKSNMKDNFVIGNYCPQAYKREEIRKYISIISNII